MRLRRLLLTARVCQAWTCVDLCGYRSKWTPDVASANDCLQKHAHSCELACRSFHDELQRCVRQLKDLILARRCKILALSKTSPLRPTTAHPTGTGHLVLAVGCLVSFEQQQQQHGDHVGHAMARRANTSPRLENVRMLIQRDAAMRVSARLLALLVSLVVSCRPLACLDPFPGLRRVAYRCL